MAILAPGQGAQTPGMLTPWLTSADARGDLRRWSQRCGLDLVRLGTEAGADEIRDTAVAQPLIVALELLAYRRLAELTAPTADTLVAGHSVGELAAAAIAGALPFDDAVEFAAVRGREMAAACALAATGMSAVMLGDEAEVLTRIDELGLTAANRNGANQIVAAGALDALAELAENPPPGAKVRALSVAGAFHTKFMAPARDALGTYADKLDFSDPALALLSNADGTVVTSGAELRRRLVEQVTVAVRWDRCVTTMAAREVATTVELPPGKTLTGLVRRQLRGVTTLPVAGPDKLDEAAALVSGAAGEETS